MDPADPTPLKSVPITSIHVLPSEILYEIFALALEEPNEHQDPATFFPNEAVKVCRQWKEIITARTEFWNWIVYFVGWTSKQDLESFLEWAGTVQELDFAILRTQPCEGRAYVEKREANSVMKILKPFFNRAHTVHIHLQASTSLPSIRELYDIPRQLSMLKLTSAVQNRQDVPVELMQSKVYLRTRGLSINGHTFSEIRRDLMKFILAPTYNLQELTVTYLPPSKSTLDLGETMRFFGACSRLRIVRLVDMAFATTAITFPQVPVNITHLELIDLSPYVTHALLWGMAFPPSLEALRLVRALFHPNIQTSIPAFPHITLESYINSSVGNVVHPLLGWEGSKLTLISCPDVAYRLLAALGEQVTYCSKLTTLKMIGCGIVDPDMKGTNLMRNRLHIQIDQEG